MPRSSRSLSFVRQLQPFQVFFPMGALFGVLGVVQWPLFVWRHGAYPGNLHSVLMIGGFFFSFAAGFLLTAIPRFTGTPSASAKEWSFVAICAAWPACVVAPGMTGFVLGHLASALGCGLLLVFYLSRRLRADFELPEHFDWIAFGAFAGAIGAGLLFASDLGRLGNWRHVGALLFHQIFVLALIVGVGSKLVTMLLGWGDEACVQITSSAENENEPRFWNPARIGIVLFSLSVIPEAFGAGFLGAILRAAMVTALATRLWKIHRRPRSKGRLVNWLRVSAWGLVLGLWLQALLPSFAVHALHVSLIVGVSWMVLLIASRVTLAHGGYDLELELRSKAILWAGIFILGAAVTRLVAPLIPKIYLPHLAYASLCWSLALLIWAWVFLPRLKPYAT